MKCKSCKTKIKDKSADYCPYCGEPLSVSKFTDINIILDRSGSMGSVKEATIIGFNNFLLEQSRVKGKAIISLYQFDNEYEATYKNIPINDAKGLTDKSYQPRATTALLDAIGKTINDKDIYYSTLNAKDKPELVLFVILTDGAENASREYTKSQIKKMIEDKKAKGWQFAFIGAGIDAFGDAHAGGMSFSKGATMAVDRSSKGIGDVFDSLIGSTVKYRSTGGQFLFHQQGKSSATSDEDEE